MKGFASIAKFVLSAANYSQWRVSVSGSALSKNLFYGFKLLCKAAWGFFAHGRVCRLYFCKNPPAGGLLDLRMLAGTCG